MNFFENNDQKTSGVFLSARHLSWLIASIIFLSFFVFIAGYFLGKKKGAEKFCLKADQDSLADQVYYSMYSLYDINGKLASSGQEELEGAESEIVLADLKVSETLGTAIATNLVNEPSIAPAIVSVETQPTKKFYAQLAGFGTLKVAEQFVEKLRKHNISIKVNKRESKTAKGKTIFWYQAVTDGYGDKAQLQVTLDAIKKVERLKDIQIKTC